MGKRYINKVARVDSKGKEIKISLSRWKKIHPGEIYFDSIQEFECWKYLKSKKISFEYQKTIELFPRLNIEVFKNNSIKKAIQRKMEFTPDFYIPSLDIYIEYKGYATDDFKMRWKIFLSQGYKGFIVSSIPEFKRLLQLLKL